MSVRDLVAGCLEGKSLANLLHLDVNWREKHVHLNLGGILDGVNAKSLVRKIRGYMKVEEGKLILKLDRLAAIEDEALRRLLQKIEKHHDRIQLVCGEASDAVREAIARLPEDLRALFVAPALMPA